jgi:hypothetical protein
MKFFYSWKNIKSRWPEYPSIGNYKIEGLLEEFLRLFLHARKFSIEKEPNFLFKVREGQTSPDIANQN